MTAHGVLRTIKPMPDFAAERAQLVRTQLLSRGIRSARVLEAMGEVPREAFVDPARWESAYEDNPLPIGERQTISQPYVVALMLEAADLKATDRLLDVGTGSGYAAAVASRLVASVYGIERHASLAERARERFRALGYQNIDLKVGDGSKGWPEAAPFNAILVAAAGTGVPEALKSQLAAGGRLVIPVGSHLFAQRLLKLTRTGDNEFVEEDLGGVAFVPLVES